MIVPAHRRRGVRCLAIAPFFLFLVMCQRADRASDAFLCVHHSQFDGRPPDCPKRS
jgi:hypothetical protein